MELTGRVSVTSTLATLTKNPSLKSGKLRPMAGSHSTCSVENCSREVTARGYCKLHWKRWRKYGDPTFYPKRILNSEKQCAVPSCNKPVNKGGFCRRHYTSWYMHGDAEYVDRAKFWVCTITGCARRTRSQSCPYCETHYYRLRRTGSLARRTPDRATHCVQCGKYRGETEGRYCSPRCNTRALRGIVEAERVRACPVCGTTIESSAREDKVFCSVICREHCAGSRVNLDVLGARDNWKCHICGRKVKRKNASADHIIPVSRGGRTSMENLALAHLSCNARRGAGRIPAQMRLAITAINTQ